MTELEVRNITVEFGGRKAVDNVSLSVKPGEITGLIGPNGAGKTTLYNVVTGLQKPTGGSVFLDSRDVTRMAPYKRARLGLARTFQRLELFLSLSVYDNIRVAGDIHRTAGFRVDVDSLAERVMKLTGLEDVRDTDVSDLPTGRARVVEVARALMTGPTVLLLDEPASGQSEEETERFEELLTSLSSEKGLAICLVEHDLPLVMGICSTVHCLDNGVLLCSGTPTEVQKNPQVIEAYIGSEVTTK